MALPTPTSKLGLAVTWASGLLKNHEWLLAIILGVALVWGITGKAERIIAAHDQAVHSVDVAALQSTVEKNAAVAQTIAAQAAQLAAEKAQVLQANAVLAQANAALSSALAKQKATDATLPPTELAARMESIAKLPALSVTAKPDSTLSITQPAAVAVVQTLEEVPVLQQQLTNTTAEKAADEKLMADQTTHIDGLNQQIGGLQLQQQQSDKVCKDEIKVVKDAARKSKRRWFIGGYVAGLATRAAIKIFTGV